ncbi:MAG: glycosyltransferase family 2 protein [Lachnospiraceae bacterium]|nr:glycosyltransferase family 2 protein [Lachnospiraceae bacterium]
MTIDVIIPVYKPGKELFLLLDKLNSQTLPVNRIILMNTEEKYFELLTCGTVFQNKYKNVEVYHLSKREFDHGRTRCMGVNKSKASVFVMMTQDALPTDEFLLEHLTQRLSGEVAVAYARQLATDTSSVLERFTRMFNYPAESSVKSAADLERLGIKTYFCSNVCAAYRRDVYDKLGGFVRRAIFNEDMLYAAQAVKAGYQIAYEADAQVYHSHNYTNMQQLRRNFDLGVSQAEHPEVFAGLSSESEGKKMVKAATQYLKENRRLVKLPYFYMQCCFKYLGYQLGKHYRKLPRKLVLKLTSNREYWG